MKQKNTILSKMSKNDIASFLYQISIERKLKMRIVNKFKFNKIFNLVFNEDCVQSEINYTIALVIDRLERYSKKIESPYCRKSQTELFNAYTLGFKLKNENPFNDENQEALYDAFALGRDDQKMKNDDLRLETLEDLTGYFIQAFKFNVLKIYSKNKRLKRSASDVIFIDEVLDSGSNQNKEQISAKKGMVQQALSYAPEAEKDFKKIMVEIANHLKNVDRKNNKIFRNKDSQLTKLFCAIVNEKKCMTSDEVKNKMNWSSYLLRKNKDLLISEIQKNFSGYNKEIIEFLDSRDSLNTVSRF